MTSRTLKILSMSKEVQKAGRSNIFLPKYETTGGLAAEDRNALLSEFSKSAPLSESEDVSSHSEYIPSERSISPKLLSIKKVAVRTQAKNTKKKYIKKLAKNKKIIVLENKVLPQSTHRKITNTDYLDLVGSQKQREIPITLNDSNILKESAVSSPIEKGDIINKYLSSIRTNLESDQNDVYIEDQIPLTNYPNEKSQSPDIIGNYSDLPELVTNINKQKRISGESKSSTDRSETNVFRKVNHNNNIEIFAASKRQGKRVRNKTHICYYCNKRILNMARHYEIVHFKESEVAKCLAYQKKTIERKKGFAEIIKVGDFYHNCNVLATKTGELILVRRPTPHELKTITEKDYGPCPNCLGFMLKKHIWHHLKNGCKEKNFLEETENPKNVMAESNALISDIFGLGFTKEYHKAIISAFRSDEVGTVCQNDVLILKFGAMQFEKYADTQAEFIRQTMRQLARLTLALNDISKNSFKSLADYLTPENFDIIIQATKQISMVPVKADMITRPEFHTPSLALKIGYALKKCIAIQRGNALRAGNLKGNKILLAFKDLMEMEWNIRISSNALSTLYKRKFNSTQLLPVTSDLVTLSKHLDENITKTKLAVESHVRDNQNWTRLATLCLARIILFNKRRSGEASKMKMSDYISRPSWTEQNTQEIRESLSPIEKKLAENMTIVEVEGKRGRRVPVLLPPVIKESIDILIRHRDECKISFHNRYVFARSNESKRFLRGHDCLKKICEEINLENPDAITGTKLRKYVATVCQLFNMSENEYDWLARHLGHDITVHREFYRMHESAIELTKISRILMAVDQGEAHKYVGKQISDINIDDLPVLETENKDDEESEEDEIEDVQEERNIQLNDDTRGIRKMKKVKAGRKVATKEPWSKDELEAVLKFFGAHIKRDKVPSKKDCDECVAKYPVLSKRPWKNIKYCVKNQIHKRKKIIKK